LTVTIAIREHFVVDGRTPFYAVSENCLTNPDDTPDP